MCEDYGGYVNHARHILNVVHKLFQDPISDEPRKVENQMKMSEAYYGNLRYLISWADYYLSMRRAEIVRETRDLKQREALAVISEKLAVEQRMRDQIHNQMRAVEERLRACQSVMKFAGGTRGGM